MKPLSIEELKAMEVGDWVWADLKEIYPCYVGRVQTGYFKIAMHYEDLTFQITELWLYTEDFIMQLKYSDYGTKWLVYKNKEQAEAKGEIVELPCHWGDTVYFIDHKWGKDRFKWVDVKSAKFDWEAMRNWGCLFFATRAEAERRLAELKGEIV